MARNVEKRALMTGRATLASTTSLVTPEYPTAQSVAADLLDLQGSADDSCS
jgi:hypothetical protein